MFVEIRSLICFKGAFFFQEGGIDILAILSGMGGWVRPSKKNNLSFEDPF